MQHRKERGRAAQAAFRKRQIDTINAQSEQLRLFNQLLSDVTEAAAKLKLSIQLSSSLEKGDVPKSVINEVVAQLERGLQRVPQASPLKEKGQDNSSNNSPTHQENTPHPISHSAPADEVEPLTTVSQSTPIPARSHTLPGETIHPTPPSSPTFPLLSLHLIPPIEILPYLSLSQQAGLPTKSTFAAQLYWATMSLSYRLARGAEPSQAAPRLLLYHLRFHSLESVAARVGRRLLAESTGVVHQDAAPGHTWQLTHHIMQDLALEGEDVKRWLDARGVELWFWRRGVDARGLGEWRLEGLLRELARVSVCFGDGPRFCVDDVERVFLSTTGGMTTYSGLEL